MAHCFRLLQPHVGKNVGILLLGLLYLSAPHAAYGIEDAREDEIETLDVIEITGSIVEQTPRDLNFPTPSIQASRHLRRGVNLSGPALTLSKPRPTHSSILLDQTAKTRKLRTSVKPIKTERPPFPRRAREQGWHGRVILQLEVLPDGTVESGTIQESSGYQLLDDEAIKAATHWTFEPAKNGGFPVASTVNIPIQFDLIQSHN